MSDWHVLIFMQNISNPKQKTDIEVIVSLGKVRIPIIVMGNQLAANQTNMQKREF